MDRVPRSRCSFAAASAGTKYEVMHYKSPETFPTQQVIFFKDRISLCLSRYVITFASLKTSDRLSILHCTKIKGLKAKSPNLQLTIVSATSQDAWLRGMKSNTFVHVWRKIAILYPCKMEKC